MRRTGFLSLAAVPLLLAAAAPAAPAEPVTVSAPTAGSVHQAGGTLFVTWHNGTGREVDMWLVRGDAARVVQLASKLGPAPDNETATVLPDVPDGPGYAIEVASRDGAARGYSAAFTVGPAAGSSGAPGAAGPGAFTTDHWIGR